jgi:pyruvate kinase
MHSTSRQDRRTRDLVDGLVELRQHVERDLDRPSRAGGPAEAAGVPSERAKPGRVSGISQAGHTAVPGRARVQDLGVEVGFQRLAELQEELLWLAEAAHTPVIWATQVLDRLVRKGTPSRAEISDVVLAQRAECVMLNKGAYLLEALSVIDDVFRRMDGHQHKKPPRLRALRAWS